MSHRRPLTKADRYVDDMVRRFPELRDVDHVIDAASHEARTMCAESDRVIQAIVDGRATMDEIAGMTGGEMLRQDIVALWSRWRTCRHVYRFDKGLTEALAKTDSPDDMPLDALRMLPYPIVFVDAETTRPTLGGNERPSHGFFAWLDDGCVVLVHVSDGDDVGITIDLEKGTLGSALDNLVRADEFVWSRTESVRIAEDHRERLRAALVTWVSHLLYIVSDRCEQKVVYRPSGKANPRKASQSTIHDVGTRLGRSLGQASVRYVGSGTSGGSGASVRPHMRAAHWHHYWTGPLSKPEQRKLVVRWLEPVFVNVGRSDGRQDTVIHAARTKKDEK